MGTHPLYVPCTVCTLLLHDVVLYKKLRPCLQSCTFTATGSRVLLTTKQFHFHSHLCHSDRISMSTNQTLDNHNSQYVNRNESAQEAEPRTRRWRQCRRDMRHDSVGAGRGSGERSRVVEMVRERLDRLTITFIIQIGGKQFD